MPLAGPPLTIEVEIARLLDKGLAAAPDAPALVSRDGQLTWRELDAVTTHVAQHYLALGLKPGGPALKLDLQDNPVLSGEVSKQFKPAEPFKYLAPAP